MWRLLPCIGRHDSPSRTDTGPTRAESFELLESAAPGPSRYPSALQAMQARHEALLDICEEGRFPEATVFIERHHALLSLAGQSSGRLTPIQEQRLSDALMESQYLLEGAQLRASGEHQPPEDPTDPAWTPGHFFAARALADAVVAQRFTPTRLRHYCSPVLRAMVHRQMTIARALQHDDVDAFRQMRAVYQRLRDVSARIDARTSTARRQTV